MRKYRLLAALGLLVLGVALAIPLLAQTATPTGDSTMDSPFAGHANLPAPDFPPGLDWINVASPLSMQDLRGRIVLLDFWTYGCINCIHMIPTLEQLEEKYGDALQIIGVHSAKFANEGQTDNLRQIVQRYNLHHPVINDSDFLVWQQYGVNAWPTFVIIDPRGNVLAMQAGEIPFEAFDQLIGGMVDFWDGLGELDRTPLALAPEGAGTPPGLLAFPGKVLADAASNRLFIADSNHHRIIVADLNTAEVLDIIGTGERGLGNGAFETATFNKPQGMALVGDTLYVADTENHAVRAVNLLERTVSTVAGTGVQSRNRHRAEDGPIGSAQRVALSSPWDLAWDGASTLYIANAGSHQIYALDLDSGSVSVAVGSGREALVNDTPAASDLAQPSGLAWRDGVLVFADSESSSIRAADFNEGRLRTLAGTPTNNLFDFGDIDGALGVNRLQHPLGVSFGDDGRVYIADTYNSRIKVYDPATGDTTALTGQGGGGGFRDGALAEAAFDEPGGLSYADGRLYVADTNNHAVRVIDLAGGQVNTLTFPNPEQLQIGERTTVIGGNQAQSAETMLAAQTVAPGSGELVLTLTLPDGYKINDAAPSQVEWSSETEAVALAEDDRAVEVETTEVRVPVALMAGETTVHAALDLYYCEANAETLCFIERVALAVPVTVADGAAAAVITLEHTVNPPQL
jgi:thiol-disulfide isomerase/thioredoxin